MKNKGFTLVELLAVIAILAILVIIALPNVMGMFNTAKENSFITECKNIYSSAQQSWMSDSVFSSKTQKYSKCETCTGKKLDLSGRDNIDYYIEFDQAGSVVKYYVTDGTYQYKYDGPGLSKTDIREVETITDLDESQIVDINDTSSVKRFCVMYGTDKVFYNFDSGMTWAQYLNSSYNTDFIEHDYNGPRGYIVTNGNHTGVCGSDMFLNGSTIPLNSQIISSSSGCYEYSNPGVC